MKVKLAIVGIRNYLANGEKDYPALFARLPIGSIVYLRKEPTGSPFPGSVSVWDDNNQRIGSISKTDRRYIELEIPEGEMLPVTVSGHAAEHNCLFVMAENTRGIKAPFIREIELMEDETVFSMTAYDQKIQQLTSMMKTKLKMLREGRVHTTESLLATANEYVRYCCESLDGETSFSRADILMELSILMESYPELRDIHAAIYEQHKDIGRKVNDVKTRVYLDQYNRIRQGALSAARGARSQMDDYLEKLRFAHGGELNQEIVTAEIMRLAPLLDKEMMKSYEKYTETDETFATALYSLNYSWQGIYRLYTRRIKLDVLKGWTADTAAGAVAKEAPEAGTQGQEYPQVTDVQRDFFEAALTIKDEGQRPLVLDMPVEWIMHTIHDLTAEWNPKEKGSVHRWRLLYEVLLRLKYFRIEQKHKYTDFVKAVVRYRFADVADSYSNNISKSKLEAHYTDWTNSDQALYQSLKEALTCTQRLP